MMATRSIKRARVALERSKERASKRAKVGSCFSVSIDKDSLEGILSKLPVKSLIRFRCVSQEWCALTKNPCFITKQHLSFSSPDVYLFLDRYRPAITDGENNNGVFEFSMLTSKSKFTRLDFAFLNNRRLKSIRCVASSNGLICFFARYASDNSNAEEFEESIIVCNPATKQFRPLPIPNQFRNRPKYPLLGFEFSHDIGEYKLVSIYPYPVGEEELEVTFRVQVLTQSLNSWRRINHKLQFPSSNDHCFTLSSITCNGALYWIVRKTHTNSLFLLSFSLRNEDFMHVIPLPPMRPETAANYLPTRSPPIFLWGTNSLALLLPSSVGPYQVLWVMKTSTESIGKTPPFPFWTRQVRFSKSSHSILKGTFMGFLNDHHFWVLRTSKGACVLYDPVRKKQIKFREHEATKEYLEVIKHVQSLLPVD